MDATLSYQLAGSYLLGEQRHHKLNNHSLSQSFQPDISIQNSEHTSHDVTVPPPLREMPVVLNLYLPWMEN